MVWEGVSLLAKVMTFVVLKGIYKGIDFCGFIIGFFGKITCVLWSVKTGFWPVNGQGILILFIILATMLAETSFPSFLINVLC